MKIKPILTSLIMLSGQVHEDCHSVHSSMKLAHKTKK